MFGNTELLHSVSAQSSSEDGEGRTIDISLISIFVKIETDFKMFFPGP
jgi:hypothetical protein